MGQGFLGSHRRTPRAFPMIFGFSPSVTSDLVRVFHPRGVSIPSLYYPTHVFFMLCNHETPFGRCPITEVTTYSPRMMNDYNHAHTPNSMQSPRAYAMQNAKACISCYMYNVHYMEQFINRTSCQVPWIIISKTYNLHPFMLIYITHIYPHIYNPFNMLFNFHQ